MNLEPEIPRQLKCAKAVACAAVISIKLVFWMRCHTWHLLNCCCCLNQITTTLTLAKSFLCPISASLQGTLSLFPSFFLLSSLRTWCTWCFFHFCLTFVFASDTRVQGFKSSLLGIKTHTRTVMTQLSPFLEAIHRSYHIQHPSAPADVTTLSVNISLKTEYSVKVFLS